MFALVLGLSLIVVGVQSNYDDLLQPFPHWDSKVIWVMWETDIDEAPALTRMAVYSWISQNPDYKTRILTLRSAEILIDRQTYYTNEMWELASFQVKTEIIKIEILTLFGGIWVSPECVCLIPLRIWVDDTIGNKPMFLFQRTQPMTIYKFPSSWFIVIQGLNHLILEWRDLVRLKWNSNITVTPEQEMGPYWLNLLLIQTSYKSKRLQYEMDDLVFRESDLPNCLYSDKAIIPPLIRLNKPWCIDTHLQFLTKLMMELSSHSFDLGTRYNF